MNSMLNFENLWSLLSNIFNKVIKQESFGAKEYLDVFHAVTDYLNSKTYHENYINQCQTFYAAEKLRIQNANKIAEEQTKQTGREVQPDLTDPNQYNESNIPGSGLYCAIKAFLKTYLDTAVEKEKDFQGESFLKFYGETWITFQSITAIANRLCTNLNSNWIHRQRSERRTYIYEIYALGMNLWNETFFAKSTNILTDKCLQLIAIDRNGGDVNRSLLSNVIQSYIAVGASFDRRTHPDSSNTLRLYQEHFEKHFLQTTENYYQMKSNEFRQNQSGNSLVDNILLSFDNEEKRVFGYLHVTTRQIVLKILEDKLIRQRIKDIQDVAIKFLEQENIENLRKAYELLKRIDKAVDPVAEQLEIFVKNQGLKTIDCVADIAKTNPRIYFETLFKIYQRFVQILEEGFANHPTFSKHMGDALAFVINQNSVVAEANTRSQAARMLVQYCDLILRKGERETGGIPVEDIIENQIINIFNYIEDKLAFKMIYMKSMGKRLISGASGSNDNEKLMIDQLRRSHGREYTAGLDRMIKDIDSSNSLTIKFRDDLKKDTTKSHPGCSLKILNSNDWEFRPTDPFKLAPQISDYVERFSKFYKSQYTGRELTWLDQYSQCDLWILVNKKRYIVTTSINQGTIFFLFNKSTSWSIKEIINETGITFHPLRSIIFHLIRKKIIQCPDATNGRSLTELQESHLELEHKIQLSTTFTNQRERINIFQSINTNSNEEKNSINSAIDISRPINIQTRIVRILKSRITSTHQQLVADVIAQLSNLFVPTVREIDQAITKLIEDKYMEQDKEDKQLYKYVA